MPQKRCFANDDDDDELKQYTAAATYKIYLMMTL
jgi:hypothetical protein